MTYETLSQYIQRILKEPLFSMQGPFDSDLFARASRSIIESLCRLDALPRSDPFWHNTNGQPTVHKLEYFHRKLLQENPDDEAAIWSWAAMHQYYCSKDFGAPAWQQLHRLGRLDLRWPIYAAYRVEMSSGAKTTHRLGQFLLELELCAEARSMLQRLPEDGSNLKPFLQSAFNVCLDRE